MVEIHLGGHLAFYAPEKQTRFRISIAHPTELEAVLQKIGIPAAEVAIASVNGNFVDLANAMIEPGDRVELFSPIGGG